MNARWQPRSRTTIGYLPCAGCIVYILARAQQNEWHSKLFRKTLINFEVILHARVNNFRIFYLTSGLFNISDKVLVSFDILEEWREHFRRGNPILNVIDSKVSFLASKSQVTRDSWRLRALTPSIVSPPSTNYASRDLDSVICGICGIAGEIYLGDGNEKNCCSNKHVSNPALSKSWH